MAQVASGESLLPNEIKKRISEGSFFALGSHSGYKLVQVHQENDSGVDFHLMKQVKRQDGNRQRFVDLGTILDFQLKATTRWRCGSGELIFPLENKSYNDIVTRNIYGCTPLVILVMCLHKDMHGCVACNSISMRIHHAFYWYHTSSRVLLAEDKPGRYRSVHVPASQLLSKDSLDQLVISLGTKII